MRAWILAMMLIFPAVAVAQQQTTQTAPGNHCDDGDDDAKAWMDACTAVIEATDPSDKQALSAAYVNRGFADINYALANEHDFSRAIADETEAIRLDPDDAFGYLNRANAWWYSAKYDNALADIADAIKRDPKQFKAFVLRCEVLTAMSLAADAVADCKHAITLGDGSAHTVYALGEAYEAAGDKDDAIVQYHLALHLNPDQWDSKDIKAALIRLGADVPR
jgi:tetratricopeptide (TPR) repeat protein